MGRQIILRAGCREELLASLEEHLNAGALIVPGSFFTLQAAAEYETLPVDAEGLRYLAQLLHAGHQPVLQCQLSGSDKPPVFGVVVQLPDDWEEKRLRAKYGNVLLGNLGAFSFNTPAEKKFHELVKNWTLYDCVTGEHDHLTPPQQKRLYDVLSVILSRNQFVDLRELASKHLGL